MGYKKMIFDIVDTTEQTWRRFAGMSRVSTSQRRSIICIGCNYCATFRPINQSSISKYCLQKLFLFLLLFPFPIFLPSSLQNASTHPLHFDEEKASSPSTIAPQSSARFISTFFSCKIKREKPKAAS